MSNFYKASCLSLLVLTGCLDLSKETKETDEEIIIENAAPQINVSENYEFSIYSAGWINATITDEDGDALNVIWKIIESPENGDLNIQLNASRKGAQLSASVVGEYTINIEAYDGVDYTDQNINISVNDYKMTENTAPLVGAITLPESVFTNDNIEATLSDSSDEQDDELTIEYIWTINNAIIENQTTSILPATLTKKDDVISVQAVVSDLTLSTSSETVSVQILDTPAEINISELPVDVMHQSLLEFTVSIDDQDSQTNEVLLAYGPANMSINDDGLVSWTPNELMLTTSEQYHFGFQLNEDNAQVFDYSINVMDDSRANIVAKSGLEESYNYNYLLLGDFDDDPEQELMTFMNGNELFTLSDDGTGHKQESIYPFELPTKGDILSIYSVDENNDAKDELIIVTEEGVSLLDNINARATLLFKIDTYKEDFSEYSNNMYSSTLADVNNDGKQDLIFTYNGEQEYMLAVYDIANASEILEFNLNQSARYLAVGNVDEDENLEIITNTGLVIDSVTGVNEWWYQAGFGNSLAVGDVNADNQNEIIAVQSSTRVDVFDPINKIQTASHLGQRFCFIQVSNIDDDSQDEIISKCSTTTVAYDAISGEMVAEAIQPEILKPDYGDEVITVGQLYANGWANVSMDNEQAVFTTINSTKYLVLMDEQGKLTLSDPVRTSSPYNGYAVISDFDNDGFDDLFSTYDAVGNGNFSVKQLDGFVHKFTGLSSVINFVKAKDINNDGFDDAIISSSNLLTVIDVKNELLLWNSPKLVAEDFVVLNDNTIIASSTRDQLTSWVWLDNKYTLSNSIELQCDLMTIINKESGDELIACSQNNNNYHATIKILNTDFEIINELSVDGSIEDMVTEPALSDEVNILLSIKDSTYSNSILKLISINNGSTVWSSPYLVGNVYRESLHYLPSEQTNKRMTFATSKLMYLSK